MTEESLITINFLVPLAISIIALFTSVYFSWQSHIKNKREFTLQYLNEWRDQEFKKSQQYVLKEISKKAYEEKDYIAKGYSNLSDQDKAHVTRVSFFLEHLGDMTAAKAVDKKLIMTVISGSVIRQWLTLRPLIYAERQNRKNNDNLQGCDFQKDYQSGFEHLYVIANKFNKKKALPHKKDKEMTQEPPVFSQKEINSLQYK